MQKLDIPVWKWDSIIMDFVTHLPRLVRDHDAVWVIIDRLTKSAHFLLVNLRISITKLAQTYIKEIVRLHGVPSSIVYDRDPNVYITVFPDSSRCSGNQVKNEFFLSSSN